MSETSNSNARMGRLLRAILPETCTRQVSPPPPRLSASEQCRRPGMTRHLRLLTLSRLLIMAAALVALAVFAVADGVPPAQASHKQPTPTSLEATVLSATSVKLTWDGPSASVQYNVQWREQDNHINTDNATTGSSTDGGTYTATGLAPETAYEFHVLTVGGSGHDDSDYTDYVTATTATVFVSNMGKQARTTHMSTASILWSTKFTTGSSDQVLGSIELVIGRSPSQSQRDTIRVELWSEAAGGGPGSKVYDLDVPPHPIAAGTVAFAAPSNTTLTANTAYWVVPYTTGSFNMLLRNTASTDEDSGAATGWSIGNTSRFQQRQTPTTGTWQTTGVTLVMKMTVNTAAEAVSPTDLSALTAESSTDGSAFSALTLNPAFDADTTEYTALVGYEVTHARLTPTLADASSSVQVGKTGSLASAASGSPSDPIALENGDNEIVVRVTDTNSNTQDYKVTVRRGPIWSATLNPQDLGSALGPGCHNGHSDTSKKCSDSETLTNDEVTFGGVTNNVGAVRVTSGTLFLTLGGFHNSKLNVLKFCVGSTQFALTGLSVSGITWSNTGLAWTAGVPVSLSIGASCAQQAANPLALSDLTAESSTDGTNFSTLALNPAFDADTRGYWVTVGNDVTHVRLTPTLADTSSSVRVGKSGGTRTTVASGSPSAAIALDVGDNEFIVEVEDTNLNAQSYRFNVWRATSDTLVSNIGQPSTTTVGTAGAVNAQGFTTGSSAGGYTLTNIDVYLPDDPSAADSGKFRAELWSAAVGGGPGAKVADLTVPSDMPLGVVSFEAPTNTALTASTTYYLVPYTIDNTQISIASIQTGDEDAGGQAGWAIENQSYDQSREQPDADQAWDEYEPADGILKIRVRGTAAQALSSNADLSGLTGSTSTDGNTFGGTLTLNETFAAATTSYTATVSNATSHVKLTPTVDDTGKATVTVGEQGATLTAVADGTASGAIELAVGSGNIITVRVTAENSTTKDYMVTITREAPQPTFLVGNMTQTTGAYLVTGDWSVAQAFTTGADSGGYRLDNIDVVVNASSISTTQRASIRAQLWSATSGGAPNEKVADLTVPAHPISAGTVSFAAPSNTVLSASTTYYAVFYTVGSFDISLNYTTSDSEDAGGAAGWSIANGYRNVEVDEPTSTTTWSSEQSNSLRIRVRGAQQTQSSNVDLSALTAESSTDGSAFSALTLNPAFAAATTGYTATVGNGVTHVRLTPTVAVTGSIIQLGKVGSTLNSVPSGSHSNPIALDVGDNEIIVQVNAADLSNHKDYTVTITREAAAQVPTVSLSAAPNPVTEGQSVTIRATLSAPLSGSVTIPLTIADVTAEATDRGTLASITIAGGATTGSGTIATNHDSDEKDETFTVALGSLPSSVAAGSPSSVGITIRDDEAVPTVKLSASQSTGILGYSVSLRAALSKQAGKDLNVRVKLLWGTGVENGQVVEYGTLEQSDLPAGVPGDVQTVEHNGQTYTAYTHPTLIRISGGAHRRIDGILNIYPIGYQANGKTFTVRLDTARSDWPSGIAAGNPSSLKVKIKANFLQGGGPPRQGDDRPDPLALSSVLVHYDGDPPVDGFIHHAPATVAGFGYRAWLPSEFPSIDPDKGVVPVTHAKLKLEAVDSNSTLKAGKVTYDNNGNRNVTLTAVTGGVLSHAIELNAHTPITLVDIEVTTGGTVKTYLLAIDPPPRTYWVSPRTRVAEGQEADLTLSLSQPAPVGGLEFTVTAVYGSAGSEDVGAIASPVTVPEGSRTLNIAVPTVEDDQDELDESFLVTVAPSRSGWGVAPLGTDTATVTIEDDDTAGVSVSAASPLAVAEGETATYTVVLDSQPTADVTVSASSNDVGAATVSPASHTFTPSGWNTPLTFTVSGVADGDTNGESVAVSHGLSSEDARYSALLLSGVLVAVSDTTSGQQGAEPTPQGKYADLIVKMKEWRNDPRYVDDKAHTDRWDRALLAFGKTVADTTLTPMTAAEAQGYADRGWNRWVEVAAALRELENRAPTVSSAIADATIVNESGTYTVFLGGVFSDADNDSLTISATSSGEAIATATVASDGSSLTVSAHSRGEAQITVTAADGNGGTVDDTFTVTVKAAPVVASAISDVSGLEAGATQEVSLSGLFSDADGDALTITATSSGDAIATATVAADQSKLTVAGVVEGTATITVTAEDADGNAVSDSFDVSVVKAPDPVVPETPNQAPTVSAAIADATIVNESGTKQVSLAGVFSDGDSDPLTVTAGSDDEAVATVSVASDYATLTVSAKAHGTATVTVTANDGNGGTVSDTFTVRVKAAPVVASALVDVSGLEVDASQEVSLSGVFRDADGDSLTITAASSADAKATVTVAADQSKLTVKGVAEGEATITVVAEDADGNRVSDAFDVPVVEAEAEVDHGEPSVVANLRCIAETGRVAFLWDAPEWSGGDTYAYDYRLTLPDGRNESGRVIGGTLLLRPGEYQAGAEASVSVKTVYELADGSNVSSAEETLTCTVGE